MTSQELAVVLEKLAKIEHKQDEYQSNFLNSPSVNENADASAFVSGTSSGKGQKELLEELTQSITAIKATIFVCFICHIYPPFTRKRIVSLYFGR